MKKLSNVFFLIVILLFLCGTFSYTIPQTRRAGTNRVSTPHTTQYVNTYYIYSFDGRLLAEYDDSDNCVKEYIYVGSKLLAEFNPQTGQYYYYTTDQINSTRIVTDDNGDVVYSTAHGPYGGIQKIWAKTVNPYPEFSGKERESQTQLDYFGARYYDHHSYRFISTDPIINKEEALENPQLWNLYAYCANNPVTYLDPDGRQITQIPPHYQIKRILVMEQTINAGDPYLIMYFNSLAMEEKILNTMFTVMNTAGGIARSILKSGFKGFMQEMGKLYAKKGAKTLTKEMLSQAKKFAWGSGKGKNVFRDVDDWIKKHGGTRKDWKKMKSWDAEGKEWHWVQGPGNKKYQIKPVDREIL